MQALGLTRNLILRSRMTASDDTWFPLSKEQAVFIYLFVPWFRSHRTIKPEPGYLQGRFPKHTIF